MKVYAERTQVSPEKSQDEIRRLIKSYGAERFAALIFAFVVFVYAVIRDNRRAL